MHWHLSA